MQPASSFIPAIRDLNYLFGSHLFTRFTRKRMAKFTPCKRSILRKENETKNLALAFKMHRILTFSRRTAESTARYFRRNGSREGRESFRTRDVHKMKKQEGIFRVIAGKARASAEMRALVASPREKVKVIFRESHYTFAFERAWPIPSRFRPARPEKCIPKRRGIVGHGKTRAIWI